ncbi:MAG: polysaccharide deacetylase family protein [Flavobacteriia bacterium]|nr:polysaccharide deacetylase family protein [Flavobacteriia bacterium]OJX36961.1 MAG: hypothetical protein BGO87_14375 [Flavobacteriia bacterium 40-80]
MKFFHTPDLIRRFSKDLVWSIDPVANEVYLTFDDGPNEEITAYILDRLSALGWQATFFCVGENAAKRPELLQRIISEGHSVGNHTNTHVNAWKTSSESYLQNVETAARIIKSSLFRPPYGKISKRLVNNLSEKYKIVMWSFMAYDFDSKVPHDVIKERAEKYIRPGSIIVLHDNEKFIPNEKAVFEVIVEVLQKKGLVSRRIY